jgi:hypothetical protein
VNASTRARRPAARDATTWSGEGCDSSDGGAMPAERRPGAELLAWSSVHGLAMLVLGGPLRDLDEQTLQHAADALIDMVDRGL